MKNTITTVGLVAAVLVAGGTRALAKVVPGHPAEYRDIQALVGVSYSGPLDLSASAGMIVGSRAACTREIRGPFAQVEVGRGGGRLAGGVALAWPGVPAIGAFGAKAFVLRTWSPSSTLPIRQTYVGAGVDVSVIFLHVGIAGYQRVAGRDGKPRGVLLTVGAGF